MLFGVSQAPATSQVQTYNSDCSALTGASASISFSGAQSSQVRLNVTGATAGKVIIISVKYSTKSIVGQPAPNPATVHFTFKTLIGATVVDTDPGGLDLVTP